MSKNFLWYALWFFSGYLLGINESAASIRMQARQADLYRKRWGSGT